ncbi:MAG TPA: hypothetical protein PLW65_27225, partial [Pseudomonadota bacterium]|nr:hypothetical protein [Pseudomonadota bacterium]
GGGGGGGGRGGGGGGGGGGVGAGVGGRGLWLGEASLVLALGYGEVGTGLGGVNRSDRRRLSVGLNLRLSAALVFKHELQFTVNDAGGVRREVWDQPALGYVSSLAFLF